MRLISSQKCFDGWLHKYCLPSKFTNCDMNFNVFAPAVGNAGSKRPALVFLSGLTCNEDNFMVKSGAIREASSYKYFLVSTIDP
jgi:S-formylglutathione hydrolase